MKILVVDDNPKMRSLVRQALNSTTESIIESSDGLDALDAYRIHRPDLVLMDIRMPGLDGLAATKQLTSQFAGARVIMLTDYDEDALRQAAFNAGAQGYILKQNISDLESIIEQLPY
jgi:CheY-like chemotaxis protein